jgi:hypothetical protein
VLATQHVVPFSAEIALSFRDTASHGDTLATAPYFGSILGRTANTRENSLQNLAAELPITLKQAADNRRVALKSGKRYIGYEGSQGLMLPVQVDLTNQVQDDPAMYDLYRQFLAGWQRDISDMLCLYYSVGRLGSYGLAAWEDKTVEEAHKLRAVRDTMQRAP